MQKHREFYVDKIGEWRWRVRDLNNRIRDPKGEIVDAASEGFSSLEAAAENYESGNPAGITSVSVEDQEPET